MLRPDLPGSKGHGSWAQGLTATSGAEMLPRNVEVGDADLRVRQQTHWRMGHNREGKVTGRTALARIALALQSQTKGIHAAAERTCQPALRLQTREEGAELGSGHPSPYPVGSSQFCRWPPELGRCSHCSRTLTFIRPHPPPSCPQGRVTKQPPDKRLRFLCDAPSRDKSVQ